jgi:hypothetical protein
MPKGLKKFRSTTISEYVTGKGREIRKGQKVGKG